MASTQNDQCAKDFMGLQVWEKNGFLHIADSVDGIDNLRSRSAPACTRRRVDTVEPIAEAPKALRPGLITSSCTGDRWVERIEQNTDLTGCRFRNTSRMEAIIAPAEKQGYYKARMGNMNSMPRAALHQRNDIVESRASPSDVLQTSPQQVGLLQSENKLMMQNRMHSEATKDVRRSNVENHHGPRTLMICNIPCRVTYENLVEAITSTGFGDAFEFVHLPSRYHQQGSNLGYAFINFFSPSDAISFARAFEGYCFSNKDSNKACTVKMARSQGFNGSYRRMNRNVRLAQRR